MNLTANANSEGDWMKLSFLLVSLICLLLPAVLSCSKDHITEPPRDQNVMIDESFEKDGHASLSGWIPDDTTSHIRFSPDVPSGGNSWSLTIDAGWVPEIYFVSKKVPLFRGTNRYRLSFWAKSKGIPIFAYYVFGKADQPHVETLVYPADTAWSIYSVIDTISAGPCDSILVGFSGSTGELVLGPTWFDLVKLEKID
jgi:hypothetical protein